MMKINFKKTHESAVLPTYATQGDAGLDLTAVSKFNTDLYIQYHFGLSVEIPEGYVGFIFPRGSVTAKDLMLKNSVGVIDSGYRGELVARFYATDDGKWSPNDYGIGDKIAQLIIMPFPLIEPVWADELTDTDRGDGSFGSTGN